MKGRLISTVYSGSQGKIEVECKHGHKWSARLSHIKSGHWCPACVGNTKSTIEEMQSIANKRGGSCLSDEYINAHTKLKWQCKEGHIWFAKPHDIKSDNTWCPYCAGKYKTIEHCRKYAQLRGGYCLSNKYEGVIKKLDWQCKEGHRWKASPRIVETKKWCRICGQKEAAIKRRKNLIG